MGERQGNPNQPGKRIGQDEERNQLLGIRRTGWGDSIAWLRQQSWLSSLLASARRSTLSNARFRLQLEVSEGIVARQGRWRGITLPALMGQARGTRQAANRPWLALLGTGGVGRIMTLDHSVPARTGSAVCRARNSPKSFPPGSEGAGASSASNSLPPASRSISLRSVTT